MTLLWLYISSQVVSVSFKVVEINFSPQKSAVSVGSLSLLDTVSLKSYA